MGAKYVTVFSFTGKLAFVFGSTVISILPGVLFPGMSQLFEQGSFIKLQNIYISLLRFSFRFGFLIGIIYLTINEFFVMMWVGNINYGGMLLTFSFVLWIIVESIIRGITSILYASSDIKNLTIFLCMESILNIILSLSLVERFGLSGVALGTVFSRIGTLIYIPYSINKKLKISNKYIIYRNISKTILFSIPTIIILLLLKICLNNNHSNLFYILVYIISALFINFISFEGVFLYNYKDLKFNNIFNTLKNYHTQNDFS